MKLFTTVHLELEQALPRHATRFNSWNFDKLVREELQNCPWLFKIFIINAHIKVLYSSSCFDFVMPIVIFNLLINIIYGGVWTVGPCYVSNCPLLIPVQKLKKVEEI